MRARPATPPSAAIEARIGRAARASSSCEAAWGIHQVVNENMASAARIHAIERGKDPRSSRCSRSAAPARSTPTGVAEILRCAARDRPVRGRRHCRRSASWRRRSPSTSCAASPGRLEALDWAAVNALLAEMEGEGGDSCAGRCRRTRSRCAARRHALPAPGLRDPGAAARRASSARKQAASRERVRAGLRRVYGARRPARVEAVSWRVVASGPAPGAARADRRAASTAQARCAQGQAPDLLAGARRLRGRAGLRSLPPGARRRLRRPGDRRGARIHRGLGRAPGPASTTP